MTAAILQAPEAREFERQVRLALASLYDVPRLQIHPFARLSVTASGAHEATAGRVLQACLHEAIDALRPRRDTAGERAARLHQLLTLRYVDGLQASVVWQRLGIGKSEYHREHGRAVRAVASILQARWQGDAPQTATSSVGTQPRFRRPLTRLIGRGPELAHIRNLMHTDRLVTLTGAGGCGKTRLAVELGLEQLTTSADGVWFVDLSALSDPALIPHLVLTGIGAREVAGQAVLAMIVTYLGARSGWLILDNCEHLRDACAELAELLLQECPGLRVLATSREALGVGGEVMFRVPSLAFPSSDADRMAAAAIGNYAAVRLFVDRARLVRPDFALGADNAEVVAQACCQLDGIPLAIELAASRLNVLSPADLLVRLEDRFQLLTGASRGRPERHQALRATVDWSYQLLTESEKLLFARLSVFAGGFTLAAAEHVGSGEDVESTEILDLLARLTDKSLVVYEETQGRVRYRLLETLRHYAADRLRELGQYEAARNRHLDYFVRLAEGTGAHLGFFKPDAVTAMWLSHFESEEDNLRAALQWSDLRVDARERGQRLAGALHWFWFVRGRFTEGRRWLERLIADGGTAPAVRVRALVAAGFLAFWKGDFVAAMPLLAEGLVLCRDADEPAWAAFAQCGLGAAATGRGEHALARSQLQDGLTAARRIDDRWVTAFALHFLAQCATDTGEVRLASSLLEECMRMLDQLGGNKGGTAFSLLHLARLAQQEGDLPMTRHRVLDALRLFVELDDRRGIAYALAALAAVSLAEGDVRAATYLFGASDALRTAGGPFLEEALRSQVERDLTATRTTLGNDEFNAVWTAGRSAPLDQTINIALRPTAATPRAHEPATRASAIVPRARASGTL